MGDLVHLDPVRVEPLPLRVTKLEAEFTKPIGVASELYYEGRGRLKRLKRPKLSMTMEQDKFGSWNLLTNSCQEYYLPDIRVVSVIGNVENTFQQYVHMTSFYGWVQVGETLITLETKDKENELK